MYLQRQEITDCVSEARAGLEQLDAIEAPSVDCKLFGFDLSLRP
jgi:hypothetical protein